MIDTSNKATTLNDEKKILNENMDDEEDDFGDFDDF